MDQNKGSLSREQILSLCQRGFGPDVEIASIQSLSGGTFNTTHLITFADQDKVVLRVAPAHSADTPWDEAFLMRREHAIQPFLAPLATQIPKTILVDFTHQLIDRDYMFQTFLEGERWEDIFDDLSPAENNYLWYQFGKILQAIHHVHGETFGLPMPGFQFARWSETILDRFERILQMAKKRQLDVPFLVRILEIVRSHPESLDEIRAPSLLHGDLWLFNLLIKRGEADPVIVGVLDADRAWWGDPMADWTMFILAHAEQEEGHAHFWKGYGQPEETSGSRFRTIVYDAMHAGRAFVWAHDHGDEGTTRLAEGTLHEVLEKLPGLL